MADPAVKMQFFGNSADAERAIVALEQKYDKLQAKIAGTAKASRRGSKMTEVGFAAAQVAAQALTAAVGSLFNEMARTRQEAEATAIALDKSARKFQIQAGLSNLQSKSAQDRAGQIAVASGVQQGTVNRIATAAASQGFLGDPLGKSGASEQIIAFLQASAKDPDQEPVEELVAGIATMLTAQNKEMTSGNLASLLLQTRGLFTKTPLEAVDLTEFSKSAKVASSAGLSQEEILVASTVGKASFPSASQASTALGNTISRMIAPKSRGEGALERVGLKTEDVDLVGESFSTALKRIGEATDALPKNERVKALADIFGTEKTNLGGAIGFIEAAQQGKFEEFAKLAQDQAGFVQGVNVARSGLASSVARGEAKKVTAQAEFVERGGITVKEFNTALDTHLSSGDASGYDRFISNFPFLGPRDMVNKGLVSPEFYLDEKSEQEIREQRKSNVKLEDLLGQVAENTKKMADSAKPNRPNRNANGE